MKTLFSGKALWVIVIVLVVVLVAIIAYTHFNPGTSSSPSVTSPLKPQQSVALKAQSIINAGDPTQCASVNQVADGVNYQTVCKNNIALNEAQKNLDISACNNLDNVLVSISDCQHFVINGLIVKEKTPSVCDQFTGDLNTFCVTSYWPTLAQAEGSPALCKNIVSSSSADISNCEYNIFMMGISMATGTPKCSLFDGAVKSDCISYLKNNCAQVSFMPLRAMCIQHIR